MSYYNRFGDNYEQGMCHIEGRRTALVDLVMQQQPVNLEELVEASPDEEYTIKLNWVKVPDPRREIEEPIEIEVMPILPVGRHGEDGEKLDISPLTLVGKLPSGKEQVIGSMIMPDADSSTESYLFICMDGNQEVFARWDSADAELFLTIAEAAMVQQPTLLAPPK